MMKPNALGWTVEYKEKDFLNKTNVGIGGKLTKKLDLIPSNGKIVLQKEAIMTKVRKNLKRKR